MDEDGVLEQQLRHAVARFDPVPPRLVAAAIDAYTWRTIDAELAQLVFDSMISTATVRGAGEARLLTFEAETLTIEVEVFSSTGAGSTDGSAVAQHARRVSGRLIPGQPAEIELRVGDHQVRGSADQLGRFALVSTKPGPFRLRCQPEGEASAVVTEWVVA